VAPATPAAPIAGSSAPPPVTDSPAVVTPAVPAPAPAAAPADMPLPVTVTDPVDPDAETYKHIDMGVWMRTGFALQNASNPKKLDGIGMGGEVEVHFSNRMRKSMAWTANFAAAYGAPDGGSFGPADASGNTNSRITGALNVLDLIAQYEPDPAFNVWVGRMLVASDRSNFSGPYFMAPWIYPLFLGPQGNPYAVVGPKEGPFGRNDGATIWGAFGGGAFKYYLGVYDIFDATQKPLISGRLALSLLSPEPGFYGSSTYYGKKDVLSIGVGGQYKKNGDASIKPGPMGTPVGTPTDYGMVLADVLFEKNLKEAGVIDLEGAFYKYVGDGQSNDFSYMGLGSYLISRIQPLVRIQQAKQKSVEDGGSGKTVSMIDGQIGYLIDGYATRFALGVSHSWIPDVSAANSVFAGIQLQK
ncbi:MAG TPA: hypothetical protein VJV79_24645, partial [Polyangiaceae bacterium]|nr:hypothetical protein [Polyangiaceae bacterium]